MLLVARHQKRWSVLCRFAKNHEIKWTWQRPHNQGTQKNTCKERDWEIGGPRTISPPLLTRYWLVPVQGSRPWHEGRRFIGLWWCFAAQIGRGKILQRPQWVWGCPRSDSQHLRLFAVGRNPWGCLRLPDYPLNRGQARVRGPEQWAFRRLIRQDL